MSWFVFSLIAVAGWGCADLFYKKGSDATDRYSHLKTAVCVGLVMGAAAFVLIPFAESLGGESSFLKGIVSYAPASLSYIISMVIGYAGLRYLELSIVSPVQNASGALSMAFMLLFFLSAGRITDIREEFSALDIIGTVFIIAGVIALAVVEHRLSQKEPEDRHYRFGAAALIFPLAYCLFDTIGTAADGIILDGTQGAGLGEIDVLILYGFTFLVAGIVCWFYLRIRTGKYYNPFAVTERAKLIAALCEEAGQIAYVYAMARKPLLAAPMVASYCIVSVVLSRIILKEQLTRSQYLCIIAVTAGIVLLGISEGLAA